MLKKPKKPNKPKKKKNRTKKTDSKKPTNPDLYLYKNAINICICI